MSERAYMADAAAHVQTAPIHASEAARKLESILAEIRMLEDIASNSFLQLGRRWKIVRDTGLWSAADYCRSFREWCERECKRSYRTVRNLILVAETFGDLIDRLPDPTQPIEHTRLVKTLSLFRNRKSKEDPAEWLHRAMTCSKKDFENSLREARGRQSTDTCDHPQEQQEVWHRCRKCDGWRPAKEKTFAGNNVA